MKRVWVFFLMVEKELQIKTLHWVPGKLRLTRQLSPFVLEHSIDASFRGIWYLDSPALTGGCGVQGSGGQAVNTL